MVPRVDLAKLPRWFPLIGWAMLVVGVVSVIPDLTDSDSGLRSSLGWPGLVIELLLDAFLIGAGIVVILTGRRTSRD